MKSIFDFDIIRKLIKGSDTKAPFNILIDSMNGGKNSNINYVDCNVSNHQSSTDEMMQKT